MPRAKASPRASPARSRSPKPSPKSQRSRSPKPSPKKRSASPRAAKTAASPPVPSEQRSDDPHDHAPELYRLFAWCILIYFAALYGGASAEARATIKVAPIATLVIIARTLSGRSAAYAGRVALGLVLCGVGDVLLELDEGPRGAGPDMLFLGGLVAFLAGHVACPAESNSQFLPCPAPAAC